MGKMHEYFFDEVKHMFLLDLFFLEPVDSGPVGSGWFWFLSAFDGAGIFFSPFVEAFWAAVVGSRAAAIDAAMGGLGYAADVGVVGCRGAVVAIFLEAMAWGEQLSAHGAGDRFGYLGIVGREIRERKACLLAVVQFFCEVFAPIGAIFCGVAASLEGLVADLAGFLVEHFIFP